MFLRDQDQADFDLEKMFEMLDEALTSKDERVQSALRALLTIIALTRTQDDGSMAVDRAYGPLRSIQEDLKNITRRLNNVENEVRTKTAGQPWNQQPYTNPGSPYQVPYPYTGQNPDPGYYTTTGTDTTLWNQK
jgi:hypothetical protein